MTQKNFQKTTVQRTVDTIAYTAGAVLTGAVAFGSVAAIISCQELYHDYSLSLNASYIKENWDFISGHAKLDMIAAGAGATVGAVGCALEALESRYIDWRDYRKRRYPPMS